MAESSAKGKQGKRYTADEKAEIVQFIAAYNAENKRGGMKTASEKYGVSVVTLSNWGKKTRGNKKKKTTAKAKIKKGAAKKVVKTAATKQPVNEDPDAVLGRLQGIRAEIATLEKEYNTLKKIL
ncbi:MAG: hypothetical protein U9Q77_07140 [Candidatus Marinimicrobia bacterium]|nr:hypothetical protein [Candidatus Neomarinimicrobiota bacterium]